MKKLSKLFAITLTLSLLLGMFSSCGGGSGSSSTAGPSPASIEASSSESAAPKPASTSGEKVVVGLSQCHMNTPYRVALIEEFKNEMAVQGLDWQLIVTDGQNNPVKQIADLEDLMSKGCDIIICSPAQSDPLTPIAKTIMDAGIPLILVDRTISSEDFTTFVGGDNINAGKVIADYILEKKGEKVNVIEMQGTLGASATNDRHKGFRDAIEGKPDFKILDDQSGDYKRDVALTLIENLLQAHSSIDVVYCHSDNMALGCINPIQSAGRTEEIMLFGTDGQKEAFDCIKNGTLEGTVFYPTGAKEAVQLAQKILNNESIEKINMLDTPLITIDNVDEWYNKGF